MIADVLESNPKAPLHLHCRLRYNEHICQFTGLQFQLVSVPFQQKLYNHCTDSLIAINESMICGKSVTQTRNFLNCSRK